MKNENNYYIKIPKNILNDSKLKSNDKLIFGIINNLTYLKGYCWASNQIISNELNISNKTVQSSLNRLLKYKYIFKWKQKKGNIVYRFLTTNDEILKSNDNIKNIIDKPNNDLFDYNWLEDN